MVDTQAAIHAACTLVKIEDDPAHFGLDVGALPGGWHLRARIAGDPPSLHERIGQSMQALGTLAPSADASRPLVEYYRRHDAIELWVPVPPKRGSGQR